MAAPNNVDLGFVEPTDYWRLLSHFFPSKVGGKPAWLTLMPVPKEDNVKCGRCGQVCVFLMQVYAPVEDVATCFHRTVFVFVCKDPTCCNPNDSSNCVVLRCQLPKENDFFSSEPPNDSHFDPSEAFPSAGKLQDLCVVCGVAGPKRCSKCHTASYCSKQHQVLDWKSGHKRFCSKGESEEYPVSYLFPEQELLMEAEKYKENPTSEKTEIEKLDEYKQYVNKNGDGDKSATTKLSEKDLQDMAKAETKKDKQFNKFKKRMDHDPEQVLRYDRGGIPLWVSSEAIPTDADIPPCSCGAARQFEFQIMPQLLNHLKVDSLSASIDWGTLAVYTCTGHCRTGKYCTEFMWKQDFSGDDA